METQPFRSGYFASGMNFLRKRFSSTSDLTENEGERMVRNGQMPPPAGYAARAEVSLQGLKVTARPSSTISAPTSPAKSREERGMDLKDYEIEGLARNFQYATTSHSDAYSRDYCKCILIIDNDYTDWSKYFRNKKLLNEYDLRVEQAEFSEVTLASYSDTGCLVELTLNRGGATISRSFQPDFVLIRQAVKTETADYRPIVTGLLYGGVPSLNSLHSIYNFVDKAWVFSQLLLIQRRLGKEKFPLIEQAYYPRHKDMTAMSKFPMVLKLGHGHKGLGKCKVNSAAELQDIISLVGVAGTPCTLEPFIESKYDIHLQKIGNSYKAFMRNSVNGNWKTNIGGSILLQVPLNDRHKLWLDEVSQLFGGLDMCSVAAIAAKRGGEFIYEVNDCSMTLLGETQEEDRRSISQLVMSKMTNMLAFKLALSRKESKVRNGFTTTPCASPQRRPTADSDTENEQCKSLQNSVYVERQEENVQNSEDTLSGLKKSFAGLFVAE